MRNDYPTTVSEVLRGMRWGRVGLIRYYCWQTALCSRKCVNRFHARREADHKWLRFLRTA
ncbi:hypothetical protein FXB38_08845 [Bradyrhizobium cytisi]|uniref:Uncharacterized protein n=1 Tax=Bradyrhizobium cytisi TaxID=515489 RepID=A0A5S4WZJ2_9BRAD|nr:hypothetical protein FXB38_08845 [Bradyrhizobium cytisi]